MLANQANIAYAISYTIEHTVRTAGGEAFMHNDSDSYPEIGRKRENALSCQWGTGEVPN